MHHNDYYEESHIEFAALLIKYRLDTISYEEEHKLSVYECEIPNAHIISAEIYRCMDLPELQLASSLSWPENSVEEMLYKKRQKDLKQLRWETIRHLAIAASVAVLLTIKMVHVYKQSFISNDLALAQKEAERKAVRLTLPGGQSYLFHTADLKEVVVSGVKLSVNNKVLNVQAMGLRPDANGMCELVIPPVRDFTVSFDDGTIARLNAGTILRFPAAFGDTRTVYIDGEGYFQIAPDAQHPFIVNTVEGSINVLGTEFNINTYNHQVMRASLVKGAIEVVLHDKHTKLQPGRELVWNEVSTGREQSFEKPLTLAWMNGKYHFRNAPLREIATMIPRYFDVQVVFDDEQLADKPFSGTMDKALPLDSFLEALKNTRTLNYYWDKNKKVLHISPFRK